MNKGEVKSDNTTKQRQQLGHNLLQGLANMRRLRKVLAALGDLNSATDRI
jgi:hypothetical protein